MKLLLPRWLRPGAPRRAAQSEPDPGDMGTAFGLDASLAPSDSESPEPVTCANDEPRWQQRLNRRPVR
jgi:hypothetical protein